MQPFKVRGSDTNAALFKEIQLDNIRGPCMKDTFRLFEWILEVRILNRAITCHLPMRNTASVHLDSNNPGACRPHHVYFRPPSLASVHEDPGALRSHKSAPLLPLLFKGDTLR